MWKVKPDRMSLSRLVRARAANLGLMAALGFLLLVSLAASAAVSALGETAVWRADHQSRQPPRLFRADRAALRRDLQGPAGPHREMARRRRWLGGTALLFTIGAAGALMVMLVWVYYSAQSSAPRSPAPIRCGAADGRILRRWWRPPVIRRIGRFIQARRVGWRSCHMDRRQQFYHRACLRIPAAEALSSSRLTLGHRLRWN